MVLVVERQSTAHHLVRHHTQTPPVHCPTVVVVLQDLGREIYNSCFLKWEHLFYWTSALVLHVHFYFIGQYRLPKVFNEKTDEQGNTVILLRGKIKRVFQNEHKPQQR